MGIWPWQGVRLRKYAGTCFFFFVIFAHSNEASSFPMFITFTAQSFKAVKNKNESCQSHKNLSLGTLWTQVIKTSWSFCVTPFQSGWNRYCWYSSSELMALMCARADMRLHRYSGTADYLGLKRLFFFLKKNLLILH